jgi:hypothetical protein
MSDQYNDYAERYNAAYDSFSKMYAKQNPPPPKPAPLKTDVGTRRAIAFMVVASVIVSGSRTIVEFAGQDPDPANLFVGIAAFAMIELGIVFYAYLRSKNNFDASRRENIGRLLTWGVRLAFLIAVVANVHASAKAAGFTSDTIELVIAIMLGVSAPTLALISGDALAMEVVNAEAVERRQYVEYDAIYGSWQVGLNAAWERQRASFKLAKKFDAASALSASVSGSGQADSDRTDGQRTLPDRSGHGYGQGYSRTGGAREKVDAYLQDNPEALTLPVRQLAEVVGVGKTVAADALRAAKGV